MDIQEKELLQKCLENDRLAQKNLYDKYKNQMYTLCFRICNNYEDANDAMQEGFIHVFRNLSSFNGDSKLGTWIHTIIARAAIKKVKSQLYFEELNDTNQGSLDWGEMIDVGYLEKAIGNLPPGYRSIFTLYEIEGFKHKEIASMLEISESTSKSQLYKAKKMLQKELKVYRN